VSRRRRPNVPQTGVRRWTIGRAAGIGISAGLAALLLAAAIGSWPEGLLYPYAALLALTAFCGASLLWITAIDNRARGTSGRMRPIRGFDLALGLILLAPALYGLWLIAPEIGLGR
jgi:hypothetical protein